MKKKSKKDIILNYINEWIESEKNNDSINDMNKQIHIDKLSMLKGMIEVVKIK